MYMYKYINILEVRRGEYQQQQSMIDQFKKKETSRNMRRKSSRVREKVKKRRDRFQGESV